VEEDHHHHDMERQELQAAEEEETPMINRKDLEGSQTRIGKEDGRETRTPARGRWL